MDLVAYERMAALLQIAVDALEHPDAHHNLCDLSIDEMHAALPARCNKTTWAE
jgi:hypothetical protein